MKKFIFGIIAVILVGIVIIFLPKIANNDDGKHDTEQTLSDGDGFHVEPLSGKNIYFKPDSTLSDNPVINDMIDIANGYAILRAAFCDAELWFQLVLLQFG